MTPLPVPHRWLAVLLGTALLLDLAAVAADGFDYSALTLPGSAGMLACAYLAAHRTALGAVAGALALVGASVAQIVAGVNPAITVGIPGLTLSELVAGAVLTVLVVWRCAPLVAIGCTALLVAACLAALLSHIRYGWWYARDLAAPLMFGLLVLASCVGVGLYLRQSSTRRTDTELRALVRRQWPLAAALAVLFLFDMGFMDGGVGIIGGSSLLSPLGVLGGIGTVITAGCAFLAPRAPVRLTLIAAVATAATPLISGVLVPMPALAPAPLTTTAASMALTAYLVRYAAPMPAFWGTAALVAANSAMLIALTGAYPTTLDFLFLFLFLLVVSVATGLYFRARDSERTQTVRAAVTSAQQGERMALARELHDVVAHHVTGIVVQAQAAQLVAAQRPEVAVDALAKIETSGAEALTAMRTLVGSLRDGTAPDAETAEQATSDLAADIRAIVDRFPGPPVELTLELPPSLRHEVGRSVLRLIQEALTNVGKHAPDANAVRLRVTSTDTDVHILITDDGAQRLTGSVSPTGGSGGYGLVGMRERVELLGGRFDAGPNGHVGWYVEAWLPITSTRAATERVDHQHADQNGQG